MKSYISKNSPELSLVIPFYNDAGCPKPFVTELKKYLDGIDYEIILVDDCSKDTTPKELDELKNERIKVIYNKKNLNYGGAIMTGLNSAKGNVIGFSCGDGEVSAEDVAKVYKNMNDYQVIKAIRKGRKDGLFRKIISITFNLWTKLKFNLKIDDINGYPVFFRREIYENVGDLKKDWLFNIDLLRKITLKGYDVHGFNVTHKTRLKGKSHMSIKKILKTFIEFISYN